MVHPGASEFDELKEARWNRTFFRGAAFGLLVTLVAVDTLAVVQGHEAEFVVLGNLAMFAAGLAITPAVIESEKQYQKTLDNARHQGPDVVE